MQRREYEPVNVECMYATTKNTMSEKKIQVWSLARVVFRNERVVSWPPKPREVWSEWYQSFQHLNTNFASLVAKPCMQFFNVLKQTHLSCNFHSSSTFSMNRVTLSFRLIDFSKILPAIFFTRTSTAARLLTSPFPFSKLSFSVFETPVVQNSTLRQQVAGSIQLVQADTKRRMAKIKLRHSYLRKIACWTNQVDQLQQSILTSRCRHLTNTR